MRSLIEIGIIPEQVLSEEFEFSPVDSASKAIVLLSKLKQDKINVFHIFNHERFSASFFFIDVLGSLGYSFEVVKNCSFNKYIEYIKNKSNKIEEISYLANNFNFDRMFNDNYRVNLKSGYSVKCLKRLGFNWPEIDRLYLNQAINILRNIGFLSK